MQCTWRFSRCTKFLVQDNFKRVRGLAVSTRAFKFDELFREREFQSRHIGPRDHEQLEMLKTIGFKVRFGWVII